MRRQHRSEVQLNWFRRTIAWIAPGYYWRWTCPTTIDGVVTHYIANHLGGFRDLLSLPPDQATSHWVWNGAELAHKRRICWTYGIGTHYAHPRNEPVKPGWNARLLADCDATDPEAAVDKVFDRIWAKIQEHQGEY
jgi:hypothetical protein